MAEAATQVKIAGIDEEQRLVFGIASLALEADGTPYTDLQDDQIPPVELEKAVYDFVQHSGEGDADHDGEQVSQLVESFVITKEKLALLLKAVGYQGEMPEYEGAAAWMGWRVLSDTVWKRVKSGELGGFSIEARVQRTPLEDDAA